MKAKNCNKGENMRIRSRVLKGRQTGWRLVMIVLIMAGLGLAGLSAGPQSAEAAITAGNSSTATTASGTSLSIAMPSGVTTNDIMIAVITNATGATVTAPSGWTAITNATGNGSATIRQNTFWKRAAAGETGPYAFTVGTAAAMSGGITTFSGVTTAATPYDTVPTFSTGNSTSLAAANAVTTTNANSMLVFLGSHGANATFSGLAGSDPSSWTYNVNFGASANARSVLIASGIKAAVGSSSTRTATASVTGRWRCGIISLIPQPTPPTTLTVGNCTDPSSNTLNSPLAPGGSTTGIDCFQLSVNQSTTTINSLTVSLAPGSYTGIASVTLTSSATGGTTYGTVSNLLSDTVTFASPSLGSIGTTAGTFYVRITPKSHTAMPAPPGSMYAVAAAVTGVTTANDATITTKNYNDVGATTIYIDNQSPNAPSGMAASQGPQHSVISWTNPNPANPADFSNVLLIRKAGSAPTFVPTEGSPYSGTLSDGSVVRYTGSGAGAGQASTYDDLQLTDGTHYYYAIWARDSRGNYSAASATTDITPGAICVRNTPIVVIQPPAQSIVTDGGQIKYMVSVTNKDVGCTGAETFTIIITKDTDAAADNSKDYLPSSFSTSSTVTTATVSLISEGSAAVKLFVKAKPGLSVLGNTQLINLTNVSVTGPNHLTPVISSDDATTTITRKVPVLHNSDNVRHKDPNNALNTLPSSKWGDSGTVTGADPNSLSDISRQWTANAYQGMTVTITSGPGSGQTRMIGSNTLTQINITSPWATIPTIASTYSFGTGWGVAGGQYGAFDCGTCHKPRATNIKSIKSTVTVPDTSNGNIPGSTVILDRTIGIPGDPTSNGFGDDTNGHTSSQKICEVCHTRTQYHNANTANNKKEQGQPVLSHNNDQDCILCHGHDVAFNALASPCDTCHGYPPPSLAYSPSHPNGTGSQTVGMHDFHNATAAAGRPIVCETCHSNAVGTGYNDNGKITIGFNIYPGKGTDGTGFKGGTYTGQPTAMYDTADTSGLTKVVVDQNGFGTGQYVYLDPGANTEVDEMNTTMMKCSNVYCHGGTMQPNGGRPWSFWNEPNATVCLTCHGASADDPPTRGEHQVHAGATGNNMPCADCHNGFVPQTIPSGLSSHVNGEINLKFDTTKSYLTGAQYTPDPAGIDKTAKADSDGAWHLTMPNIPDDPNADPLTFSKTYGTCQSAFCHTSGSPKWGSGSLPNSCNSCHSDQGAGHAATHSYTSSHSSKHTQSYMIACEACHTKLNTDGSQVTHHAKGFVTAGVQAAEVGFTNQPADGTIGSRADDNGATFYYRDLETSPYGLGEILPTYVAAGSKAADVPNNGSDPIDPSYNYTSGTCSTVWCHSNANPLNGSAGNVYTTPTWASGTIACNGCHSVETDASRTWSPAHDKHTRGAQDTTKYSFGCTVCHNATASSNTAVIIPNNGSQSMHANGNKDIVFSSASGGGTASGAGSLPNGATCSNIYCHSNGTSVSTGAAPSSSVVWGTTLACNGCHGNASGTLDIPADGTTGRPNYADKADGGVKANEHMGPTVNKHSTLICYNCHANTVDATGAISASGRANHANGAYDVTGSDSNNFRFAYTPSGAGNGSGGTCSNMYCHSQVQASSGTGVTGPGASDTPQWGDSSAAVCANKCHKGYAIATGTHTTHVNAIYNVQGGADTSGTCARCHSGGYGDSLHANYQVNFALGTLTGPTTSYNESYSLGAAVTPGTARQFGTCSVYCHSSIESGDGTGAATYSAPQWGGAPVTDKHTGDDCTNTCHGTASATKTLSTGSHAAHIAATPIGAGLACSFCHNGAGPVSSGPTLHADGSIELGFNGDYEGVTFGGRMFTGPVSGSYSNGPSIVPGTAFGTCSVSCHGSATPSWTGGGLGCDICHPYTPTQWSAGAAAGGYSYQSGSGAEAYGAHAKHITNIAAANGITLNPLTDGYGTANFQLVCGVCHDTTSGAAHHSGTVDVRLQAGFQFGSNAPAYNGTVGQSSATSPKTCSNVSCHYQQTPVWSAY